MDISSQFDKLYYRAKVGRKYASRPGSTTPMLEGAFALGVVSYRLTAAVQFVFISEQPFQADRPSGMEFAVTDSQFGAQAVAEAVGKAG
jgi:hypothetical protein